MADEILLLIPLGNITPTRNEKKKKRKHKLIASAVAWVCGMCVCAPLIAREAESHTTGPESCIAIYETGFHFSNNLCFLFFFRRPSSVARPRCR